MRPAVLVFVIGLVIAPGGNHLARAQTETTIESGDANIVLTVWEGSESPMAA